MFKQVFGLSSSLTRLSLRNVRSSIAFAPPLQQRSFSYTSPIQATLNQIKRGVKPPGRKKITESPDLEVCPIRKGVVLRVMVLKPKKPNSAQRKASL